MNNFFWIAGQKGMRVLITDQYINRKKGKTAIGKIYWKASNAICTARATTENSELIKTSGVHMHNNDFDKILKTQLKDILKNNLSSTLFLSAKTLYDNAVRSLCEIYSFDSDTMSRIVSFDSIKASIYRWKSDFMYYMA